MAWEDRQYSSEEHRATPVRDAFRRVLEFFNQSLPLGTYLGIRVRLHLTFLIIVFGQLALALYQGQSLIYPLRWISLLFLSVVAHEFGHCLACRSVGGTADDILMWPLGGLAFCVPPRRPWPEFVTVICGPLVNFVIAGTCFALLVTMWSGLDAVDLHPLRMWAHNSEGFPIFHNGVPGLLADLFVVNYALLLFNVLLIFYPFDGGRLIQIGLWKLIGYGRSMVIATRVGMVGAILVALVGLVMLSGLLILIAIFGFVVCYQQGVMLRYGQEPEGFEYDLGYNDGPESEEKLSPYARWKMQREQVRQKKEQERMAQAEQDLDRILAKIKSEGLASLTSSEKRILQRATKEHNSN
jgi:Zn-dependent protease